MTRAAVRKFSVSDAMILVGAAGIALAWLLARTTRRDGGSTWETLGGMAPIDLAPALAYIALPISMTAIGSVVLLRLRNPRPRLARLACQPGFAACASALMAFAAFKAMKVAAVGVDWWRDRGEGESYDLAFTWERLGRDFGFEFQLPGYAVLAAWLTLGAGGLWRAERSWVDRAGRALGAWCLIQVPLHLRVLLYYFAFEGESGN